MRAIDTNVAVRFLFNDDPDQGATARRIVAGGVFVPLTVLLELNWLLGSRYRLDRASVADMLREFIDLSTVTVVDQEAVRWAIDRFACAGDFADLLHLVGCQSVEVFSTFDRGVVKAAGSNTQIEIETLG